MLDVALRQITDREEKGFLRPMASLDKNRIALKFINLQDKVLTNVSLVKKENVPLKGEARRLFIEKKN